VTRIRNKDGITPSQHALFFSAVKFGLLGVEVAPDRPRWGRGRTARWGTRNVTTDDMEIVSALRAALADKVGKERYELWFGTGTRLEWDGAALTVGLPNGFFLDFVRANFRRHIEHACLETLAICPPINYHIVAVGGDGPSLPAAGLSEGGTSAVEITAGPTLTTGGQPVPRPVRGPAGLAAALETPMPRPERSNDQPPCSRRKFASLGSFVSGQSNRLALVSSEMVARSLGQITPLVIYGPTSVGKTHLLEGIWTAVRRASRAVTTVYLSAEQFTSQFLEALRGAGLPSFRRKYRGVGLFCLDDLQFLSGKRATQVELQHTIDTLLRDGRQLVLAADRPPAELTDFTPELLTRLTSGMVCRIDPPEFATRLGIVSHLAKRMGVELPADVERYVAARLNTHARDLSGAICRLQATSAALGQPITLALAEEALCEMIQHTCRVVRLPDIQQAVCSVFGLEAASLQSDAKHKRLAHPRMLAMWLARKHTRAALSEIGQFFGRRSHSTVVSAQKRVDQWMADGESLHLADKTWIAEEAIRQVERQLAG
jgi:chromosomal replication initiator protein